MTPQQGLRSWQIRKEPKFRLREEYASYNVVENYFYVMSGVNYGACQLNI
jgi:hypothetical protein